MVKSSGCSYRGSRFSSRSGTDDSQLPVTLVLGESDALFWLLQALYLGGKHTDMEALTEAQEIKRNKSLKGNGL